MNKVFHIFATMAFVLGAASFGMAMDQKGNPGEANTPDKIQRSAPSGEPSLPGGSGPGSRSDELTEMEEVDPKDPKMAKQEGAAAQAAKELQEKGHGKGISGQSSSQKSH